MQLLLGLFFFSILVTTGTSLQCVDCLAINGYCSNVKKECLPEENVCMEKTLKSEDNKNKVIIKHCNTESNCKLEKNRIGEKFPPAPQIGVSFEVVLQSVVCSRAPPAFASFFPALLGLLLVKLLC